MAGFALALAPSAAAQSWPAKPARIVMPFPPGGGTDIMGRLLAKRFTETPGQSFVPENRPGAGELIGAKSEVAKYARVIAAGNIRAD